MQDDLSPLLDPSVPSAVRPDCPVAKLKARLREAGLRPTRQRVILGWLLFGKGDRHVSAEDLYTEACRTRAELSLATVYNTLRQFADANLVRQVNLRAGKAYFDTNTSAHHHYAVDGEDTVFDVPASRFALTEPPEAPPGFRVVGVDIVVRLERVAGSEAK